MLGKILAATAGLALVTTPVLAQPSAQALSVQPAVSRASGAEDGNNLTGGGWIAPVLAAAIVIGGVLLATGVLFDDDDDPVSP